MNGYAVDSIEKKSSGATQDDESVVHHAIEPLTRQLIRLRRAAKRRLLFQAVGFIAAAVIAGVIAAGFLDFVLRLPWGVRAVMLAIGLTFVALAAWRLVPPAWRFRPALRELALRLERSEHGAKAGLSGVVASGLDLAKQRLESDRERRLVRVAVEEAVAKLRGISVKAVLLDAGRTRKVAGMVLGAAALTGTMFLAWPELSGIGAKRILTPWVKASWPKRTGVVDANTVAAHPTTSALPLRALMVKSNKPAGRADIEATYRILVDGKAGPDQKTLLTWQSRRATVVSADGRTLEGELYERLIEPSALSSVASATKKVELEYAFRTDDDSTEWARVVLVEPPSIRQANARITPPDYASGVLGEDSMFVHGEKELGTGFDDRASISPVLMGSKISLTLELNKTIPSPVDAPGGSAETLAFLRSSLIGFDDAQSSQVRFEPSRWTIEWTLRRSSKMGVVLIDNYGIRANEQPVFRFDAAEDRSPTITVVQPAQDEHVLPTAVIDAAAEARDDVAIASLSLQKQLARPAAGSVGAAPEVIGSAEIVSGGEVRWEPGKDRLKARTGGVVEIAAMEARPGDEVWLTGVATDSYNLSEEPRAEVRSTVRRLRIISESELVEQVRMELSGVRDAAIRLEQEQSKLSGMRQRAVSSPDEAATQEQRQNSLTERLGPLDDVVKRLMGRIERNRLDDPSLTALLDDAGELLEEAARQSESASDQLEQLSRHNASDEARQRQAEAVEKSQEKVEQALTELASMLDQGQDSWAVRRAIEKLIAEQRRLESQTASAGEGTQGRESRELSQEQRDELDRLSRRQEEMAQRTGSAVESLEQRGKQLEQADPGQSKAMRQAADRARREQIEQTQREAAQEMRENKTASAESKQRQATRALEEMLEDLDRVQTERDQALRRLLAELSDSIRRLAERQAVELDLLARGMSQTGLEGLDRSMIQLHQDTLAVGDRVREQMPRAVRLTELMSAAAEAQSAAITALRLNPVDGADADENERISLARLREAVAEIEKLEAEAEQRDTDRKRAELLKQYRLALEEQAAVIAETMPYIGKQPDRKDRNTLRALGARETALKEKLAEMRSRTEELSEAKLFDFAHQRLDSALRSAAKSLGEGSTSENVAIDEATAFRVLQSLVEALRDAGKKKDDFQEDDQSGGGGDGSGGNGNQPLVPPIAELKLLRMMQAEAAELTRAAEERGSGATEAGTLQRDLAELGRGLLEKLKERGQESDRPKEPLQ